MSEITRIPIIKLYDNLIASCRGQAEPLVTGAQLLQSMSLIDGIFASARSGSQVNLSAESG